MIIPTFVNFTVAFTPIVQLILGAGTVTTFMVAYLLFNGISEFGGINWEAVLVAVIASACFASLVLSFVNILFLIAFAIVVFIITYMEFGWIEI
jgi:hypothetical protein